MKCMGCGHDNGSGAKFCTMCGGALASAATRPKYYDDRAESEPRQNNLMLGDLYEMDLGGVYGRIVLLIFLTISGLYLILTPAHAGAVPFMKLFNFPFDLSGKVLFSMFAGRKVAAMGGFLMMGAVTFAGIVSMLFQKQDPFGASVFLWWHAQIIYLLNAAIAGTHNIALSHRSVPAMVERETGYAIKYMFGKATLNNFVYEVLWIIHALSSTLIALSLIWMTIILIRQFRRLRDY